MFLPDYAESYHSDGNTSVLFSFFLKEDDRLEMGHCVDYVVPAGKIEPIFLLSVGRLEIVTRAERKWVIEKPISSLPTKYVVALWRALPALLENLARLRPETIEMTIAQYRMVKQDANK